MNENILFIGSSNTVLIAKVKMFPKACETKEGISFMQPMGGKGTNQALASHPLGGNVEFAMCIGDDIWGIGNSLNLIATGKTGAAISYGLGQGATLLAALWGVFIWKELAKLKI